MQTVVDIRQHREASPDLHAEATSPAVTTAADGSQKKLYKIGVSFDEEKRTIGEWKIVD